MKSAKIMIRQVHKFISVDSVGKYNIVLFKLWCSLEAAILFFCSNCNDNICNFNETVCMQWLSWVFVNHSKYAFV